MIHTFPTQYDYLFASWKWWWLVLPVWWLPQRPLWRYMAWLDRQVVPRIKRVYRWLSRQPEMVLAHCNCLTRERLETLVRQAGFVIRHSHVETTYPQTRSRRLMDWLFRHQELTRRNIYLIGEKIAPAGELMVESLAAAHAGR